MLLLNVGECPDAKCPQCQAVIKEDLSGEGLKQWVATESSSSSSTRRGPLLPIPMVSSATAGGLRSLWKEMLEVAKKDAVGGGEKSTVVRPHKHAPVMLGRIAVDAK